MKLNKILLLSLSFLNLFASDFEYSANYYGNLAYSALNKDGFEYRSFNKDYVTSDGSFSTFSKLGAQLNVYKDNIDLNFQALAKDYNSEVDIDTTWLNLKYTYNNYAFRVGRMQMPLFLNSNTIDIDYIHLWTKAPIELYGIFPATHYDGIEFLYFDIFDEFYLDLQITPYAKLTEDVSLLDSLGQIEAKLDDIRNIMFSIEYNYLRFSGSYTEGKLTLPLEGTGLSTLVSTLQTYGFSELADEYSMQNTKLKFFSTGINYEDDIYIFSSEYAQMDSKSLLPSMKAYYLMAGYKTGKITPYIMYARNDNDEGFYSVDELNNVSTLKLVLESELYKMNSSQITKSIGLKYEYQRGIALNFQLDRITTSNYGDSSISGDYERLGFLARKTGTTDEPVYMYTMNLEFAF